MKLPMKLLRTAGLCLVAMFAMSMVAAVSASAAPPVWEHCTEGTEKIPPTKYTEHQCVAAAASFGGKWQWNEVKGTEAVVTHGSLVLKDTGTLVGTVAVSCSGTDEGSVGPGRFDRTTAIPTADISCSNVENCEKFEKAEARNLPWQTEITEEAGTARDKITNGKTGKEAPGWAVTCTVDHIPGVEDRCTSSTGSTSIENKPTKNGTITELLVLSDFETSSGTAECSEGTSTSGTVRGTIATLQANGWGLRIS